MNFVKIKLSQRIEIEINFTLTKPHQNIKVWCPNYKKEYSFNNIMLTNVISSLLNLQCSSEEHNIVEIDTALIQISRNDE